MKQILVGVDGSSESRMAVKKAAELAAGSQSAVRLVCVVPPIEVFTNVVSSPRETRAERAAAQEILDEMAKEISGVPVETQIADGIPSEVLARMAATPDVDMIVVGHHGRGAMSRLIGGSVSNGLMQTAPKPVLVVR